MPYSGPIVIVEDDIDDQELFENVLVDLEIPNERIYFKNPEDAWVFLKETQTQPCVIISDMNLPRMNGLEFKRLIDSHPELKRKSIPFVFLSTTANKQTVSQAFTELTVQGFFEKQSSISLLKQTFLVILNYWKLSKHPNVA
jgi:CheY-like chemotaxis protein